MTRWMIALIVCWATLADASTKRVAVIVGNNAGGADQTRLRYAETDAGKLARVLTELGGVAPDDLFLLQGKNLAALTEAFTLAKRRIAGFRADPTNRVIVLFYFSGHSDGEALELGHDRLTFSELRRWLAAAGADVRVALVDSCKSGALLTAKGGTPGPAFQIRLTDDLASTGEALLTSSAADEVALESREIGGSFFTHHFISGLRGAADASGDGLVTLAEAYQYAYAHTLKTTGETIVGPQHPAYNYQLSGQGELVLAELSKPTGALELPKGFDRILVIDLARDQVIAEVTSDAHGVIAVQPGRYAVRAWRGGKTLTGRVTVALGETRSVRSDELSVTDTISTNDKGGPSLDSGARTSLFVAAGGARGVANDVGLVLGLRIELRVPSGVSLALTAGSRYHAGYRESSSLLLAGYRRGIERDGYSAWAGAEAGAGVVVQSNLHPD
ncbi:MAG TPA: caspase family protein, partial [Kofleriaceae bacterium]